MIKTIELFAGVGGFRVGLQNASDAFDFVWANQWEPGRKKQFAWECYEKNFGLGSCVNKDIHDIKSDEIPDFDLLTAGFPCQDYSVAKSLKYSNGIEGKKGVLWWEINRIIEEKSPKYVLLENVDRLIKSPAKQRGRDFAIILKCLMNNNYKVEWRVVNASDYGMPQKRKRVFIFASKDCEINLLSSGFPFTSSKECEFHLNEDLLDISENFLISNSNMVYDYGVAYNNKIYTKKIDKSFYDGDYTFLRDIVEPMEKVDTSYIITNIEKWKEFKLGRKVERVSKDGHAYIYSEGKMSFPDSLDKPGRTIITGEGGSSPSRFKHVIEQNGIMRRLTPIELERMQMFPDGHTDGFSDNQRAFMMGNALVTGVVEKIGKELIKYEELKND